MRGKFQKFKKGMQSHYEEGQNKIYQILGCLQQMHQLRVVQKIARPISYQQKQTHFQAFKQKFLHLHFMLQSLRKELPKDSQSGNQRPRGTNSTLGVKQKVKRQDIRKIQSAYKEVLIEGSFRYYYLVAKAQGLPLNLQAINIQEWAAECLQEKSKQTCC